MMYRRIYGQCRRSVAMNRVFIYTSTRDLCVKLLLLFCTEPDNAVFTVFLHSYINISYPSNWTVFEARELAKGKGLGTGYSMHPPPHTHTQTHVRKRARTLPRIFQTHVYQISDHVNTFTDMPSQFFLTAVDRVV